MELRSVCDVDVAVIGAGVAGLAAAATVRARGMTVTVLEAGARVGGRAHTVQSAKLGHASVDLGASWLHMAAENPLTQIAHAAGLTTTPFAPTSRLTTSMGNHYPTQPDDREAAEALFEATLADAGSQPDASVLDVLRRSGVTNPWFPTIATLEGAVISAADLQDLSFADWKENALNDDNLWLQGGMGAFVAEHVAPRAGRIELGWKVDALDWNAPFGGVVITGERGTIKAAACVLTVSTGVLLSGAVRFLTPLPEEHLNALSHLPMGLLSKVVFPATAPALRALQPDTGVDHFVRDHGDPAMVFIAKPSGSATVIGHCGGRTAWDLSRAGAVALEDFARSELAAIFGSAARAWLPAGAAVTSTWGEDPLFAGAYSYGKPGCGDARDVLARPIGDGRLCIAGEACHRGMAGTVQAAWITGIRSAAHVAAFVERR